MILTVRLPVSVAAFTVWKRPPALVREVIVSVGPTLIVPERALATIVYWLMVFSNGKFAAARLTDAGCTVNPPALMPKLGVPLRS